MHVTWHNQKTAIAFQAFQDEILTGADVMRGADERCAFLQDVPHPVDLICDASAIRRIGYDTIPAASYLNRHKPDNLRYVVFVGTVTLLSNIIRAIQRYIHGGNLRYHFADTIEEAEQLILAKRAELDIIEPATPTL